MKTYLDESGDFSIKETEGSIPNTSVVASLVVPDSRHDFVSTEVEKVKRRLKLSGELHFSTLGQTDRRLVCKSIAAMDLAASVTLTDNLLVPEAEFQSWRSRQAQKIDEAFKRSKAAATGDIESRQLRKRLLKLANPFLSMSAPEYLQFGALLPLTVLDSLQAALIFFQDQTWRNDFASFRWTFDGKLAAQTPGKKSSGEKLLEITLPKIFAGDERFRLRVPDEIADDLNHPYFVEHRMAGEGPRDVGIHQLLKHPFKFEDSRQSAHLQVADCIAGAIRGSTVGDGGCLACLDWLKPMLLPHVLNDETMVARLWSTHDIWPAEFRRFEFLLS